MSRLCVLCYEYTYNNLPFCYPHYKEFEDVINEAIRNKAEWLRDLEKTTQKEYRRLKRQVQMLPLEGNGEDRLYENYG